MSRRTPILPLLAAAMLLTAGTVAAQTPPGASIDIPFQKFVLDNGLTLIVHEDHKAPIAAVNIWYHVGSKNEPEGRTGFAHLFEHLMFNGSENHPGEYFEPFERVGATDMNGTTNEDRTNYFENVPTPALDMALWMESDRMGHLVGAIDQGKLDEQRGVVQNEKRQGENQPYAKVFDLIPENSYPAGHPYHHTVIGSMEDLDAASLDDVKQWFSTYYGPNNAVLVVAGDVNAETVHQKVQKYFGDIPPGPPIEKAEAWIAPMRGSNRQIVEDRVPQARIYKIWNVPEWGSPDETYLDLVTDVLAAGKTSRLYKRLVYDDQIATDARAFIDDKEIGGQVMIWATALPGEELGPVEKAVDEELARFIAEGPTAEELERVKTQYRANFIRGIERIGGFGGKSDVLARNQAFLGRPDAYKQILARVASATAADLQGAAKRWLSDGVLAVEVHPYPKLAAAATGADRSQLPAVGTPPKAKFASLQRASLSNGMNVIVAERHAVPVVLFQLMVDAGFAADAGGKPGTADLAMDMMDEGTASRSSLEISDQLARLGATLNTGSNLDMSTVSLSTLKENLDPALELYADVVLHPSFPDEDFKRLQAQQIAAIQREKVSPVPMALRIYPALLYGKGHAYGNPLTGSGTEQSVASMTTDDLKRFHDMWFHPNNATLVVVGDITMAELKPKLERRFAGWKRADVPKKNIAEVAPKQKSVVYLVDRPGSGQSIILAGNIAPPKANPDEIAIETMNAILGGQFGSRINMNLREDKHWSYGAFTLLWDARGQRPFIVYAPVQTDKTKESMQEVQKELEGILGSRPVQAEELSKAQNNETLQLPGRWETNGAVAASIAEMVRFGLPADYFDTFADRVNALGAGAISAAAKEVVQPDRLVWVVVGDRSKIEAGIRELGLGDVRVIDVDGEAVTQ